MQDFFKVHLLTDEGIQLAVQLSDRFRELAKYIDESSLDGREKSLAFTKLEEASFFAKKAIAISHCQKD